MTPLPNHCQDCDKPTLGTNALCPRCLADMAVKINSGLSKPDNPKTTADLEQKIVPSEVK